MRKISIADCTLSQKRKASEDTLSFKEKVEIARLLESAKADVVEFSAIENEKTDTLLLRTVCAFLKNSVFSVDAGTTKDSIEMTYNAISSAAKPRLRISLPASPVGMEYTCHKKAPKMLVYIEELVTKAVSLCPDVEFCAVDATRAEKEFLVSAFNTAIKAGAKTITIYDNDATMLPDAFAAFAKDIVSSVSPIDGITVGVMCENGLGMAVASSALSLESGVSEIKCACGASGIPSLETVSQIIRNCGDRLGYFTALNYTELSRIANQIAKIADSKQSETSPFSMTEAKSISDINEINLTETDTITTVNAAVKKLGYDLSEDDNAKVFESFKRVAAKKPVSSKELDAIVASSALQVSPTYVVKSYVINSGNIINSSAQVVMEKDGEEKHAISVGDGPIDASFLAIEQIVGHHYELDDFQIQAVTEGREAMGSALVKLRSGRKLYSGNGISTDIIGASVRAYVNALNKIVFEEN